MRSTTRNWREVCRNLTTVATMADRFLDLTPQGCRAIFHRGGPISFAFTPATISRQLRQAKDIVRLLESAEGAWKEAYDEGSKCDEWTINA